MDEIEKKIRKELFDKLKNIYDNKDFVIGVLTIAQHPEDMKTIIDFIDAGEDINPSNIIALSVLLDDVREKPRKPKPEK